jgi:predicted ABC-type ATPase
VFPADLEFLNADEIAKTLPGYPSRGADIRAGRQLLEAMADRESRLASFAVETTLSGRTLASRIIRLRKSGYSFSLIYLWTPNAEFSIQRVAERVRLGGHHVPAETIRRRFLASLKLLCSSYIPIADSWTVYDNTDFRGLRVVATGGVGRDVGIREPVVWNLILEKAGHADHDEEAGSSDSNGR